jgi:multidrug efflux pump subunit AcrA (membrane-fusion protein)
VALAALLAWPVRLTVLAPGEMVPAKPLVVRAPMEGVLDTFHVQPNQVVQAQQPLFGFDEALIQSRLEVARQSLVTAQTEYRQTSQQALMDPRARSQLSQLAGKIDERRAEAQYLADQLKRSRVLAPKSGVVLMDDPSEWIGRPVTVGERILRIAAEGDVEVEAWLPLTSPDAPPALWSRSASPAPSSRAAPWRSSSPTARCSPPTSPATTRRRARRHGERGERR